MRLLAYAIAASIVTIVFTASSRRSESLSGQFVPRDDGFLIHDSGSRVATITLERDSARDISREALRAARAARFQRVFKDKDR